MIAFFRNPWFFKPQHRVGNKPIDWNARLQASLRPDPDHLKRRQSAKRGWVKRRGG